MALGIIDHLEHLVSLCEELLRRDCLGLGLYELRAEGFAVAAVAFHVAYVADYAQENAPEDAQEYYQEYVIGCFAFLDAFFIAVTMILA